MVREQFRAIGTHWDITIEQDMTPDQVRGLFLLVRERIEQFESTYSRFRDGTLIDSIAHHAGDYTLPDDARPMFDLYQRMYTLTDGSVTPLIGATLEDAGYDKTYSLKPKTVTIAPKWEDRLNYVFPILSVKAPTKLDVGAIGKGYCIDIIGALLESNGVDTYTIDAGGDIRRRGDGAKVIALEHPDDTSMAIGTIEIESGSICGSAGNRRRWANLHHIIDPKTGLSPMHLKAIWVVAETTMLADAMTTALFFMSPEDLLRHFHFGYVLMHADNSVTWSQNLSPTLF